MDFIEIAFNLVFNVSFDYTAFDVSILKLILDINIEYIIKKSVNFTIIN